MISAIITAYKEPRTIQKAVTSILNQDIKCEILVVAPDKETLDKARELQKNNKSIRLVKDPAEGKPKALNLAVSHAKGDILIFTDGDVFIGENTLRPLVEKFSDKKVGAVSGRPISTNPRDNKFGFWSHMLTEIADERRTRALKAGKRFFCSGYLFAIRKKLFPRLPIELLSEDGYISHEVYKNGYKIAYSKESEVHVKYPNNFRDWILQKKRSAGGYNQIRKISNIEIRSFRKESLGAPDFFKYTSSIRELYWLLGLFAARFYLWIKIYNDLNLKKKTREDVWLRVESTK